MAAGISGDGLQRVRGSSPGLRNNKKRAVTVTFELVVIGLAQKFEARGCEKVSPGHTQARWSADLQEEITMVAEM